MKIGRIEEKFLHFLHYSTFATEMESFLQKSCDGIDKSYSTRTFSPIVVAKASARSRATATS